MKNKWLVIVSVICAFAALIGLAEGDITVSRHSFAAIAYSPATEKIGFAYNLRSRKSVEKAALEDGATEDARVVAG